MRQQPLTSLFTSAGLFLLLSVAGQAQTMFSVTAPGGVTGKMTIDDATGLLTSGELRDATSNCSFTSTPGIPAYTCSFSFPLITAGGPGSFPTIAQGTLSLISMDRFQVRYAANLAIGDSVINFTNAGSSSTSDGLAGGGAQNGDICANVYAYSPDEQLVSCCSCNVTPNALNSLSVKNDLASNTLTPIIPSALVVKVLATEGGAKCTAGKAASVKITELKTGLLAWGTTIHALPVTAGSPATAYGVTETPFSQPFTLSGTEITRMTQLCAFIRANGSGYGICKSCKVGGLGAATR